MNLQLEDIGIIEKADIKLDGLTVIAGENDSGKSTVGKVLYSIIKSISKDGKVAELNLKSNFSKYFDGQISNSGKVVFEKNSIILDIEVKNDICNIKNSNNNRLLMLDYANKNPNVIMIETPLVWNLMSLFTKLPMIENEMDIELDYPKIMKDLHWNLSFKGKKESLDISSTIEKVINGEFVKNNSSEFYFQKSGKRIKLINTATGIKYFGILQVLSANKHLHKDQILILDEPEVHLHPKWQLKLAEVIVYLVKNGVKILVNSHSPYMIEALQRYGELESVNFDFYLAQSGKINKIEDSNSRTLSEIFEKLSEPFDVFEEMESERL